MTAFPSTNARSLADALQTAFPGKSPGDDPLSASNRRELASARDRARSIRRAARLASFNGWTTAAAAVLSGAFLAFDRSAAAITVTAGLAVVAYNEFRGRRRLLSFDPSGATLLGWNQLGLLAMVVGYCLWMLNGSNADVNEILAGQLNTAAERELLGSFGDLNGLYRTVTLGLYGGAIVLSLLFQGGNAVYYFSRRRHVEDFVAETPLWVREIQSGSIPV